MDVSSTQPIPLVGKVPAYETSSAVKVTLWMSPELRVLMRQRARAEGLTMACWARNLLRKAAVSGEPVTDPTAAASEEEPVPDPKAKRRAKQAG